MSDVNYLGRFGPVGVGRETTRRPGAPIAATEAIAVARQCQFSGAGKIVAAEGEVALGIWRFQPDGAGRHVTLAPPREEYLNLQSGDRLVVLCNA